MEKLLHRMNGKGKELKMKGMSNGMIRHGNNFTMKFIK